MLNIIWTAFFLLGFLAALWQWFTGQNPEVFSDVMASMFDMASLSVEIAIGLIGLMALWRGFFALPSAAALSACCPVLSPPCLPA
jgi:spore maturation protein SpmA